MKREKGEGRREKGEVNIKAPNSKSQIPSSKLQESKSRSPRHQIRYPISHIRNPIPQIRYPNPISHNPKSEISNPKSEIPNRKSEISNRQSEIPNPQTIGWREWLALPELGLLAIEAKVDTGAATSALHADDIEPFERDGQSFVRFRTQPISDVDVVCEAPVVDQREVADSSGHSELRFVISTMLRLGVRSDVPSWPIELTLADRSTMQLPMLLGREAMAGRIVVDPSRIYSIGRVDRPKDFYVL